MTEEKIKRAKFTVELHATFESGQVLIVCETIDAFTFTIAAQKVERSLRSRGYKNVSAFRVTRWKPTEGEQ
jgi:hypothetical protein